MENPSSAPSVPPPQTHGFLHGQAGFQTYAPERNSLLPPDLLPAQDGKEQLELNMVPSVSQEGAWFPLSSLVGNLPLLDPDHDYSAGNSMDGGRLWMGGLPHESGPHGSSAAPFESPVQRQPHGVAGPNLAMGSLMLEEGHHQGLPGGVPPGSVQSSPLRGLNEPGQDNLTSPLGWRSGGNLNLSGALTDDDQEWAKEGFNSHSSSALSMGPEHEWAATNALYQRDSECLSSADPFCGGDSSFLPDTSSLLHHHEPPKNAPPSRHLWLGNLNPRLSRQVLREVLQQYGLLEDVVTFPGRMYAFANFCSVEDATAAAARLQNQIVPRLTSKRRLVVRFRPSRKALGRMPESGYTANGLYASRFSVDIPARKESDGAPEDGSALDANRWTRSSIDVSALPDDIMPDSTPSLVTKHLWLGNIPLKPSRASIEECFKGFGPLESVRVFPGKTYAFVNFEKAKDAAHAKESLDGMPCPSITASRPMIIRFQVC